jgi:hypothetical protein
MSYINLPRDKSGGVVPVLNLDFAQTTGTVPLTSGGTSARAAIPSDYSEGDVVYVACTNDIYITFGNSSVDATTSDVVFPYGGQPLIIPAGATHVAVLQVSAAGSVSVSGVIK